MTSGLPSFLGLAGLRPEVFFLAAMLGPGASGDGASGRNPEMPHRAVGREPYPERPRREGLSPCI